MNTFTTRHLGLSASLVFVGKKHLSTVIEPSGRMVYTFDDADNTCSDISQQFFSPEGMITSDARFLLECLRVVKRTLSKAIKSPEQRWDVTA